MRQRQLRILLLVLSLILLALPPIIAHGAGGRIEGKVTDPKGAALPVRSSLLPPPHLPTTDPDNLGRLPPRYSLGHGP